MSLIQEILYTLSNYPGGYKIIYNILYDGKSPKQSKKSFENNLRNTLSRMKRNGFVVNDNGKWSVTPEGEEFLSGRNEDIKRFFPTNKTVGRRKEPASIIVAFDIPEKRRRYRDWLRAELVGFGFEQIQKSVWFGPALPKNFIKYLEEIDILKHIRFFKANEKTLI